MRNSVLLNPHKPEISLASGQVFPLAEYEVSDFDPSILQTINIRSTQISGNVAVNIGMLGANAKSDATYNYYLYEFTAETNGTIVKIKDNEQYLVTQGVGFRSLISAAKAEVSGNLNLEGIAAQASINGSSFETKSTFFGLDEGFDFYLQNFIQLSSDFNGTFMKGLGSLNYELMQGLQKGYWGTEDEQKPVYSTLANLSSTPYTSEDQAIFLNSISAAYAYRQIRRGLSYVEAMDQLRNWIFKDKTDYDYQGVDPVLVQAVYEQEVDPRNLNQKPSSEQKSRAKQLDDLGQS